MNKRHLMHTWRITIYRKSEKKPMVAFLKATVHQLMDETKKMAKADDKICIEVMSWRAITPAELVEIELKQMESPLNDLDAVLKEEHAQLTLGMRTELLTAPPNAIKH